MSLLKTNHCFSYSQLSSFSECPFAYYLKHIEGQKDQPNGFSEQGTLIHDILDKWAKGQLKKPELAAEYERRYPEEVITSFPRMLASKGYAEKTYLQGLEYFKNFDEFIGYDIVSAEEGFRMPLRLADGTERPFVAYVDLVLRNQVTGGLVVCDHKSKSLTTFKRERDTMYKQQYLYAFFIHEKYGEWPESLMFNLFKENGAKDEQLFSKEKFDEVIRWATDAIKEIEAYDVLDWMECKQQKTPGKPDMFCSDICGVRASCPNSVRRND